LSSLQAISAGLVSALTAVTEVANEAAVAATEVAQEAASAAAHGAHEAGGAALVSPDFAITIATWIAFGALVFLISRFGWNPLVKSLDDREHGIQESVRRAEAARNEAERLLVDYNAKLSGAKAEVDRLIAEGRSRGEAVAAKIELDANARSQELITKAQQTIDSERQKAVAELRRIVADAGVGLASKILHEELDATRHERLVDEVVREVGVR
jgi:F-type H+-transporting ATPase subunit b